MLVHEYEMPTEIPIEKMCSQEAKKFIIVQNHVREIISTDKSESNMENATNISCQTTDDISQRTRKKSSRILKKRAPSPMSFAFSAESVNNKPSEISHSDLEELRSVYNKCKEVIEKIETKYGHLLNINTDTNSDSKRKSSDHAGEEECHCMMSKKIIFKDDGEQETIDTDKQGHICPKKFKRSDNTQPISRNIEIQYSENEIELPDDLEILSNMLKNPDLEITYRNKIIDKVKSIKQELQNEIRFNKHSLIDKLKVNPYELLDFKGTNLASLPGYS